MIEHLLEYNVKMEIRNGRYFKELIHGKDLFGFLKNAEKEKNI